MYVLHCWAWIELWCMGGVLVVELLCVLLITSSNVFLKAQLTQNSPLHVMTHLPLSIAHPKRICFVWISAELVSLSTVNAGSKKNNTDFLQRLKYKKNCILSKKLCQLQKYIGLHKSPWVDVFWHYLKKIVLYQESVCIQQLRGSEESELNLFKWRENKTFMAQLLEGVRKCAERLQIWKTNFVTNSHFFLWATCL